MRNSIRVKYAMIRYYYTQMMKLTQEGGAFYKPLFFEFPNDANAYFDQEQNVMLGSALKLGIATKTNQNITNFYYPAGKWCSVFYEGECTTSTG
jgi:alpha-glucosidase (family GH31 glycosyl hydrolase)